MEWQGVALPLSFAIKYSCDRTSPSPLPFVRPRHFCSTVQRARSINYNQFLRLIGTISRINSTKHLHVKGWQPFLLHSPFPFSLFRMKRRTGIKNQ